MHPVEAWGTIILFVILSLFLIYAIIFERQPEPTEGWECNACRKKVIGMKSKVEAAGWDTEFPPLCPKCRVI